MFHFLVGLKYSYFQNSIRAFARKALTLIVVAKNVNILHVLTCCRDILISNLAGLLRVVNSADLRQNESSFC